MRDHYSMKKQWQLTLESWDKSTKGKKKVKAEEACGKSHNNKKKVKEEAAGGVAGATVSSGAPGSVGGDDGGYDSDAQNNIAVNARKVGKRKTPLTRTPPETVVANEEMDLEGDMKLSPEIDEIIKNPMDNKRKIVKLAKKKGISIDELKDAYSSSDPETIYYDLYDTFRSKSEESLGDGPLPEYGDEDPESQEADKELNNLYHRESIQRSLDEAFNKVIFSESIAFQEEGEEDMGMEDDIEDVDDPEMSGEYEGGDELPLGDEGGDEMLPTEPEGEEIPDDEIGDDVNARLDKIEGMLQQLLGLESSEEEISDIEGEDAADIMGDMGMDPMDTMEPEMDPEIQPEIGFEEPMDLEEPEEEPMESKRLGEVSRRGMSDAAERNRKLRRKTEKRQ